MSGEKRLENNNKKIKWNGIIELRLITTFNWNQTSFFSSLMKVDVSSKGFIITTNRFHWAPFCNSVSWNLTRDRFIHQRPLFMTHRSNYSCFTFFFSEKINLETMKIIFKAKQCAIDDDWLKNRSSLLLCNDEMWFNSIQCPVSRLVLFYVLLLYNYNLCYCYRCSLLFFESLQREKNWKYLFDF